jgi:perosamine synthetase
MKNKEIEWWRTSFGTEEIRCLAKSISEEHISQGPVTAEFEAKFAKALNVPYAVATTSGSVALLMALMALGIKPGDEVIVPNRTFIATAHAALMLGAKVVLVDVRPDIPALDVSQIKRKITRKTKVIMPVHLNGRAVNMEGVGKIAEEFGLKVVEDACQALLSRNSSGFLGTQSDAGCFSLGVTKLLSVGQGGMVVTRQKEVCEKLKLIRNHGVHDTFSANYQQMGFNFKFTDMMASIGLVQLNRRQERVKHVKNIYQKYNSAIADFCAPFLKIIPVKISEGELPLYIEALCTDRPRLMRYLNSHSIRTRPFLPNLHLSPHLNNRGSFPQSQSFHHQGIFLPAGPSQSLRDVDRVVTALWRYGKTL